MCVTVLRSAPKIDPRSMLRTTTAAFPTSIFYPSVRTNRRHTGTRRPERLTYRPAAAYHVGESHLPPNREHCGPDGVALIAGLGRGHE
jgi:hypothetical protein